MLVLNLIQADSGIFKTLAYLATSCFTHFQAYSQSYILGYIYRGILANIRGYFSRFRHIQNPCIAGPNSVNQHLLLKSGSSFKSIFKSIWNIFSICFKNRHSAFCSSGQYFNNINNNNNNMSSMFACHSCHTKTPLPLPTLNKLARHPRQYVT